FFFPLAMDDRTENEYRSCVVRARKRTCVEPWVIGIISFLSLIVLAVCIGLT
ncbi:transmembrane protease, serine 11e, isoform CRA_b, partial [Mus musculus]